MTILAAALFVSGCGQHAPPPQPPAEVGVVTIHQQPATLTAELPGRTDPFAVSQVRPQVNGIILKRLFTQGTEVKEGQTLYQIDPRPYQAAYDNAAAVLATAQAKAKRYAVLLKENAVAPQDYDDVLAAYKQAAANTEAARINLNYTRVTAPISGRVGISNVTEGALVTANQTDPLTTVQTLDPIYVDIVQSSTQLLELKQAVAKGQINDSRAVTAKAQLVLEDGTVYPLPGVLQFADVTVDQGTGAVTLRALFPNPSGLLLPGMYVRATIAEGVDQHAMLAPQQGVIRDTKGQPTAWIVGANDKVEMRNLVVSRAIGFNWLVTSGLKDGDRLVVEGTQKLRPGMLVKPVAADLSKLPPPAANQPGY